MNESAGTAVPISARGSAVAKAAWTGGTSASRPAASAAQARRSWAMPKPSAKTCGNVSVTSEALAKVAMWTARSGASLLRRETREFGAVGERVSGSKADGEGEMVGRLEGCGPGTAPGGGPDGLGRILPSGSEAMPWE